MILSTHGVIASQIQSFVGLLDTYPNAAAAYSVRLLRSGYTGNAIRVRRSSDNAEQNIGFTALGNLDTTALTTFCSGTNGFVTTWYDQSGNNRDATQTTAANQPQIVNSGSVLTLTGVGAAKPCLSFDGTNDSFNFSSITAAQFTTFYPSKKAVNADLSAWFTRATGTPAAPYTPIIFGTAGTYIGNTTKSTYITSYNNNNYILMSGYINSSNDGFIQINNSAITLGTILLDPGSNTFDSINQRGNVQYSKCTVPEMIFYASDNSTNISAINTNINSYYGIY
jgi:3D (Asp-Asp-Asp) domain-containing protein